MYRTWVRFALPMAALVMLVACETAGDGSPDTAGGSDAVTVDVVTGDISVAIDAAGPDGGPADVPSAGDAGSGTDAAESDAAVVPDTAVVPDGGDLPDAAVVSDVEQPEDATVPEDVGVSSDADGGVSPSGTSATIGPAGGTISHDGAVLIIPPGALDRETLITLDSDDSVPASLAADPEYVPHTKLYDFEPDGLTFAIPATLKLMLPEDGEARLAPTAIYWSVGGSDELEGLPTIDDGVEAVAEIHHFSKGTGGSASCAARVCWAQRTVRTTLLSLEPVRPGASPSWDPCAVCDLAQNCGTVVRSGACVCGDGTVGPSTETRLAAGEAPEECDDGNTAAGDGCAADCTVEAGWTCGPTGCQRVCSGPTPTGHAECDDGDPCTEDLCQASGVCSNDPAVGAACDDGDLGTRDDVCDAAGACAGTAYTCTVGICETASVPNGTDCDPTYAAAGVSCDDGDLTTRDDVCDGAGACAGSGYTCAPAICETASTPNGVGCVPTYANAGAVCDDGSLSTRDDVCDGAGGCAGTAYTCTVGICETASVPNGADCDPTYASAGVGCDDGNLSTRDDLCDGSGGCAGTAYTCTVGICETASVPNGTDCDVTYASAGAGCDDGSLSTRDDVCDGSGGCAGTAYTCTMGVCETASAPNGTDCDVTYAGAGVGCDDGNLSTRDDVCDGSGGCAGTAYTCTVGVCETASAPNGTDCDVTYASAGVGCDDGNLSTRDDVCDGSGGCAGTAYTCTVGVCETASAPNGTDCDVTYAGAGTGCDDGNLSTRDDVCDGSGGCAGSAYTCTPGVCETASAPNGTDCDVTYAGAGAGCDDGNLSTRDDVCDGSGGCAGSAYTCTPGVCETASAPNGTDCDVTYAGAGTGCDDGNLSTRDDVCDGSGGCAGSAYTCTPGVCETASAPNGTDCNVTYAAVGAGCDDGNVATRGDVCDGAGGCAGTAYTCTPGVCESASEPNGTDCDVTYAAVGATCDDGDFCTTGESCDGAGACSGGSAVSCDDGDACTTDTCVPASGCVNAQDHCGNAVCDCGETYASCAIDCPQPGTLDLTFGDSGYVTHDLAALDETARAVVVLPSGRIVIAGDARDGDYDFLLAAWKPNGDLDTDFASPSGYLTADLEGGTDRARALGSVASDARLVALGHASAGGSQRPAMIAVTADGARDGAFHSGGFYVESSIFAGLSASFESVAVAADGLSFWAGGSGRSGARFGLSATQFDAAGILTAATPQTVPPSAAQFGASVAVSGATRVLLGGWSDLGVADDLDLMAFTGGGLADSGWDGDGVVTTDLAVAGGGETRDRLRDVAVDGSGNVIAVGSTYAQGGLTWDADAFVARYLADGSLDTSFGTDGKVVLDIGTNTNDEVRAVALQADGAIVLCGRTGPVGSDDSSFFVARLTSAGQLDARFGSAGVTVASFLPSSRAAAWDCTLDGDGAIVVVGEMHNGTDKDVMLVRVVP